jgi:hypothetical protein
VAEHQLLLKKAVAQMAMMVARELLTDWQTQAAALAEKTIQRTELAGLVLLLFVIQILMMMPHLLQGRQPLQILADIKFTSGLEADR